MIGAFGRVGCLAVCCGLAIGTTSHGQSLPKNREETVAAAKAAYENAARREALTLKQFAKEAKSKKSFLWHAGFPANWKDGLRRVEKGVELRREKGAPWSVDGVAEVGDVIRVYRLASLESVEDVMTLVYVGEQTFPNSSKHFSFFIYPYRTRLEYNTLPARIHDQYLASHSELLAEGSELTDDPPRHVRWLRESPFQKSVFLKTRLFDASPPYYYDVYEPTDATERFSGFNLAQRTLMEQALGRAISLNRRSIAVLKDPTADTLQVAAAAFGLAENQSLSSAQIAQILATFEKNAEVLQEINFKYLATAEGQQPLTAFSAAWNPLEQKVLIDQNFFHNDYKGFRASGNDENFYRSHVILHEAIHKAVPFSGEGWEEGHWGGKVQADSDEFNSPKRLRNAGGQAFTFANAVRNPYCYQYFAIWMTKSEGSVAKELFQYVLNFPYQTVLDKEPIDFQSKDLPQGKCQYRAQAILLAVRQFCQEKGRPFQAGKIFSIGSGYPNASITPTRNGAPIGDVHWGFHVAPVVDVGGTSLVFDPSLFSQPVTASAWKAAQDDAGGVWTDVVDCAPADPGKWPYKPSVSMKPPGNVKWVTYEQFLSDAVK